MGTPRGTILVVDDELGVRRLLAEILQNDGYRVVQAANGPEAARVGPCEQPVLAIVDMRMPGQDGLWTMAALQAAVPCLPVILMSAVTDRASMEEAATAGASGSLVKPFDIEEVARLVRLVLARTAAGAESFPGRAAETPVPYGRRKEE